jgi:hypothetical protein
MIIPKKVLGMEFCPYSDLFDTTVTSIKNSFDLDFFWSEILSLFPFLSFKLLSFIIDQTILGFGQTSLEYGTYCFNRPVDCFYTYQPFMSIVLTDLSLVYCD